MKKYIFLLILLSPIFCFAQNWAENAAIWHYDQIDFGPPFNHDYLKYTSIGDTTILGMDAKKIKEEYITIYDTTISNIFMRSENNQVFLFDTALNSFRLIYDFSATTGETINVFCRNATQDTTIEIMVDSVSSININGHILGVQYVSQPESQEFYMSGMIIENIGWTGFLFPIHSIADPPFGGSLRCYEDNEIGLYKLSSYDCDYMTSIETINSLSDLSIFPNPTNGIINIETDKTITVEIFDISGKTIYYGAETKIDISKNKKGLYFLRLVANPEVKVKKIMLQ